MFVDRQEELDFLKHLLTRNRPGPAQLALLFGRRRVGKSELLLQWAAQSGLPYTYWEAVKESANQQRTRLMAKLLNIPPNSAPVYRSWSELWDAAAPLLQRKRHILILDELPYTADTDTAMLSSLQYAWDQHFQKSEIVIVLCGSHVRVMETLMSRQSPLFGRMTDPTGAATITGPCGDSMEFYLAISDERIEAVKYHTRGCDNTRNCGRAVARRAQGRNVMDALAINPAEIIEAGECRPQHGRHCAILAVSTLYRAIADYLLKA